MVECCDNELTKTIVHVKQQMTYKNHKFETICMTKVVTNCQKYVKIKWQILMKEITRNDNKIDSTTMTLIDNKLNKT